MSPVKYINSLMKTKQRPIRIPWFTTDVAVAVAVASALAGGWLKR